MSESAGIATVSVYSTPSRSIVRSAEDEPADVDVAAAMMNGEQVADEARGRAGDEAQLEDVVGELAGRQLALKVGSCTRGPRVSSSRDRPKNCSPSITGLRISPSSATIVTSRARSS